MRRPHRKISLFVLLLCLTAFPCMAQDTWNVMTEELPPYNFMQNNQVHGISAEILLQLMEKNGISIDRGSIQLLPWARAYRMAQDIPGSILFSTCRTAERDKLFKWVGPIIEVRVGLMALKKRNIQLRSLEDTKKYTIGTIRDDASEQLLLEAGMEKSNLDRISSLKSNIKKLQAGRIDMFAFCVYSARYLMTKMGLDLDDYECVYTIKRLHFYYAFHKDTDDQLINAFNKTLQEMKQSDSTGKSDVDRIIDRYSKH